MNDATTSRTQSTGAPPRDLTLEEFLGVPQASPWRRWRKWIVLAGIALVVVLLLWYFLRGGEETTYATADVERGNLTVTVSATGNLQPTNQVQVGSEQSGLITDVYVDNNDQVTKGQPLARLDTSRLRDTITQNQASIAAAQASVAQAEASAVNARASLNRLEEVYQLSGGKVPSKAELDSARAENLRAIAQVRAAQAQVTQARATLSSSNTNLAKATIYSPVNGVVLLRQVDPGQTVAASFSAPVLFTIAEDLSKMKLEVKVDEADIGQVKEGLRATFAVDAYPGRTFPALISRIDVGSSTAATTGQQGNANTVVSYMADLAVQNPDFSLRPGMTATADIVTMQKCNVLLIPNSALRFNPNAPVATAPVGMPGTMPMGPNAGRPRIERQARIGRGSRQSVYVLGANGEPQAVQVTVGNTNGALTEVVGGLKPGQKVITSRLAAGVQPGAGGLQGAGGPQGAGGAQGAGGPRGGRPGGPGAGAGFRGQGRGQQQACVEESGEVVPGQGRQQGQPGAAQGPAGGVPAGGPRPNGQGFRAQGPQAAVPGGQVPGAARAGNGPQGPAGRFQGRGPGDPAMRQRMLNASPEERAKMRAAWQARNGQGQRPGAPGAQPKSGE